MTIREDLNLVSQPWQLDVEPTKDADDASSPPRTEKGGASIQAQHPQPDHESPPPLDRIVEALCFIATEPVSGERLCQIIRGLTPDQLQESITRLNHAYRLQTRPYLIERHESGYALKLKAKFRGVLERLYGNVREARFSQAAVETLAVIAYRQPIAKTAIETIRGQDCEGALRQLIRRGLVCLQDKDADNQPLFRTTPRFLEFFQLKKVEELPRADDLERV